MPVLTSSSLGRRAVQAAAISTLATIYPAAAQQVALTPQQCRDAIIIAGAIKDRFAGKMSVQLIDSFARFRDSNCDLDTNFVRETPADNEAFKEFRLRLIAMRTADVSKPQSLANR